MNKTTWEFHDSVLAGVTQTGENCVLHFATAYLRVYEENYGGQSVTGWVQEASLFVGGVCKAQYILDGIDEDGVDVWRGEITVDDLLLNGVADLPLNIGGSVSATFTLMTGEVIQFEGNHIEVRLHGEPVFVEPIKA
jgi:hypothetical protein